MSPTLRFSRDEEGYPVASVEPPFENLGQFINIELGEDPIAAIMLAETISSINSGQEAGYEADGREFTLQVSDGYVRFQSLSDADVALKLGVKDFVEAIKSWKTFLLESYCPPLRDIIVGITSSDGAVAFAKYSQALTELKKNPEQLRDQDGELLISVFSQAAEVGKKEIAEACVDLLLELNRLYPQGAAGGYLFQLAAGCQQMKMEGRVDLLYRAALAWGLNVVPLDTIDGQRHVFHIAGAYVEYLKDSGESFLTKLFDEIGASSSSFGELSVELYKATGLYNAYLRASGALNMMSALQDMMRNAGAGDIGSTLSAMGLSVDQGENLTIEQIEARVRTRINASAEATQIFNSLLAQQAKITNLLKAVPDAAVARSPELYEAMKVIGDALIKNIDNLKPSGEEGVDMTPPSVSYKHFTVQPEAVSKTIKGNIGKSNPRPGSPNAEPVIIWGQAKSPRMRLSAQTMATRLSTIGSNYVMNFHSDQATAFKVYLDELENGFEEKPHFVAQCLTELAAVYELENRLDCVDQIKNRLSKYKNISSNEDDQTDLKRRGISLFVLSANQGPAQDKAKAVYDALANAVISTGVEFTAMDCNEYDKHPSVPGQNFLRTTIEAKNIGPVEDLILKVLDAASLPETVLLELNGGVAVPYGEYREKNKQASRK